MWLLHEENDFDRFLNEQLKKLQTDHIDFYLFHALNKSRWDNLLKLDLFKKAEGAIQDGRIGHIGFSFHDTYDSFPTIIDGYDKWDFCQIQYNYMDIENQAGMKGLQYAASKGLAVIAMEPLLGGKLANPPQTVRALFDVAPTPQTPADWALQWLWDQPEVSVLLSGMSRMEQVEENLQSANRSRIHSFGAEGQKLIEKVRNKYHSMIQIPCTKCQYCMPCPNGVNIPRVFELYNDGFMHANVKPSQMVYHRFLDEGERAKACIQCRTCEEHCPQRISISEWMPKVHQVLSEDKPYSG